MDFIPSDPILEFHSDTLVTVRKLYNLEKPEEICEVVQLLDDWVKKQNHFTKKDFSKTYLERLTIMLKGSVERAKKKLEKSCTARTSMPKYFAISNPKDEFDGLKDIFGEALLPKLTKENHRVFVLKYYSNGLSPNVCMSVYRYGILLTEYMTSFDYNDGLVVIFDIRDECFQMRIKGVHILTESNTVDLLLNILKQLVTAKIAGRFHVHKDAEGLYDYVARENLPSDLGGSEKSIADLSSDWLNLLSTKENIDYFKELSEARTDESLRQTDTTNEKCMEMAGTFRRLNVD